MSDWQLIETCPPNKYVNLLLRQKIDRPWVYDQLGYLLVVVEPSPA